ncbi:uncharacterized protein LOC134839395 isoform X3 [Symsagittifera roscoffensis]|uniref:uncharacterized protein LOC134839395 isoform X3 n=1 Tax=Symsagittifera roscoffensis TaxID=84072 RepID=UPI00307C0AF0
MYHVAVIPISRFIAECVRLRHEVIEVPQEFRWNLNIERYNFPREILDHLNVFGSNVYIMTMTVRERAYSRQWVHYCSLRSHFAQFLNVKAFASSALGAINAACAKLLIIYGWDQSSVSNLLQRCQASLGFHLFSDPVANFHGGAVTNSAQEYSQPANHCASQHQRWPRPTYPSLGTTALRSSGGFRPWIPPPWDTAFRLQPALSQNYIHPVNTLVKNPRRCNAKNKKQNKMSRKQKKAESVKKVPLKRTILKVAPKSVLEGKMTRLEIMIRQNNLIPEWERRNYASILNKVCNETPGVLRVPGTITIDQFLDLPPKPTIGTDARPNELLIRKFTKSVIVPTKAMDMLGLWNVASREMQVIDLPKAHRRTKLLPAFGHEMVYSSDIYYSIKVLASTTKMAEEAWAAKLIQVKLGDTQLAKKLIENYLAASKTTEVLLCLNGMRESMPVKDELTGTVSCVSRIADDRQLNEELSQLKCRPVDPRKKGSTLCSWGVDQLQGSQWSSALEERKFLEEKRSQLTSELQKNARLMKLNFTNQAELVICDDLRDLNMLRKNLFVESLEFEYDYSFEKGNFSTVLLINNRYSFKETSTESFDDAVKNCVLQANKLMFEVRQRRCEDVIPGNQTEDSKLLVSLFELKTGLLLDNFVVKPEFRDGRKPWAASALIEQKQFKSLACHSLKMKAYMDVMLYYLKEEHNCLVWCIT